MNLTLHCKKTTTHFILTWTANGCTSHKNSHYTMPDVKWMTAQRLVRWPIIDPGLVNVSYFLGSLWSPGSYVCWWHGEFKAGRGGEIYVTGLCGLALQAVGCRPSLQHPALAQCWASVRDAGSTLSQRLVLLPGLAKDVCHQTGFVGCKFWCRRRGADTRAPRLTIQT